MARRYSSFQHVTENLARTFYGPAENCIEHPGYKYRKFETFEELDAYFKSEFGDDWREQEWAKFWIRSHNREEKNDYSRNQANQRGVRSRKGRTPGSRRHTIESKGPRQLTKIVPKHILIALIDHYISQGVRGSSNLEKVLLERENISIDDRTIRLLKQDSKEGK